MITVIHIHMAQLISISLTWRCQESWAGRSMYAMAEVTSDCSGEKGRALFRKLCKSVPSPPYGLDHSLGRKVLIALHAVWLSD